MLHVLSCLCLDYLVEPRRAGDLVHFDCLSKLFNFVSIYVFSRLKVITLDHCDMSATKTRTKTDIWLIGQEADGLTGTQLPSKREILSMFFHKHLTLKRTVKDSASIVSDLILEFWNKARIPCKSKKHLIPLLEKDFKVWQNLKKSRNRNTQKDLENQVAFCENLDDLYDIAHPQAFEMIKIQ